MTVRSVKGKAALPFSGPRVTERATERSWLWDSDPELEKWGNKRRKLSSNLQQSVKEEVLPLKAECKECTSF